LLSRWLAPVDCAPNSESEADRQSSALRDIVAAVWRRAIGGFPHSAFIMVAPDREAAPGWSRSQASWLLTLAPLRRDAW